MNFGLSAVVPTNIANAASSATAALNKAKEAGNFTQHTHSYYYLLLILYLADKLAEEMLKEHLKLVDKNLGSIEGEIVTSSNAMLPDLVKGIRTYFYDSTTY